MVFLVSSLVAASRPLETGGEAGERRNETRTWMRERTTWYGYVAHNAAIFDAADMTVYAVLD
jgi:hypothetical protein